MYSNNNLSLESENMTISEDEDDSTVVADKSIQGAHGVIDWTEKLYLDM